MTTSRTPFIESDHVELHPIETDDQIEFVKNVVNQAPHNHIVTHTPFTADDVSERVEMPDLLMFTVHPRPSDDESDGEPVGMVMGNIEYEDGRIEIGYATDHNHSGNGYATAAAKAITNYAFERLPVDKAFARTFGHVEASRHILNKIDYEEEAVIPEHRFSRGNRIDIHFHAIYREDWETSPIYQEEAESNTVEVAMTAE